MVRQIETILATLVGLVFLVQGCATTQESANLQRITDLEQRVRTLELEIQGTTAGGKHAKVQTLADLAVRIEELEVEIGKLKGRIEELEKHAAETGQAPVSAGKTPTSSSTATSISEVTLSPVVKRAVPKSPEESLYSQILQTFQEGNYDDARKRFQEFLKQYPDSKLADNALYWIGESYYAQQEYQAAIKSFQAVIDRYPDGNKVPAALLREGDAFLKLGDTMAARILYQKLLDQYPDTPQAKIASRKLKNL